MANAYGTEKYHRFIQDYLSDFAFEKTDEKTVTFNDLKTNLEFFEYSYTENGHHCYALKTDITITDSNNADHVYECIDTFMYPCTFNHNDSAYLVFRKTLYGYTILNLTDFTETNYFPSDVLDGNESFIMCDAKYFGGLLMMFGSFWGGPYICYALDLETFDILNLSNMLGIKDLDYDGINISTDSLTLVEENTHRVFFVRYEELKMLVSTNGNTDL